MLRRSLAAALVACLATTGSALAWRVTEPEPGEDVEPGRQVTVEDLTATSPVPPADIYRPSGSEGPAHQDLATFAWLEFIALVAPADSANRGQPGGSFSDSGSTGAGPLVWETYQHRSELFPYSASGAVPPQTYNDPPTYIFKVTDSAGTTKPYNPCVDDSLPSCPFGNLDEASQIGQNLIFFPGSDGTPFQILFEAKVNQVETAFVTANFDTLKTPIELADNTIHVKAAWVPLESIPADEQYRYYTNDVIVYGGEDDAPAATVETYALIGLHIIQKTPNFPAFIFATFEHTDVLTTPGGDNRGVFYQPTYQEIIYTVSDTSTLNGLIDPGTGKPPVVDNPTIAGFDVDAPIAQPNGTTIDLPVGSVLSIPGAHVVGSAVEIPVVQPPTTNSDVDAVNTQVLSTMSSLPGFDTNFVWQYYKLKGVQGVPTSDETALDYYLADIAIESSQPGIQLFRGAAGLNTGATPPNFTNPRNQSNVLDEAQDNQNFSVGGCQGCHGVAQTQVGTDFSFLFGARGGTGFSPDTAGLKDEPTLLERANSYFGGPHNSLSGNGFIDPPGLRDSSAGEDETDNGGKAGKGTSG
ncbi:MAG: hypothetical protein JNM75_03500 [Rhodospirillales bacterium]|nr:hypothetical protein [Rhodospirillales bacterium]